jgi:hypothetical protein
MTRGVESPVNSENPPKESQRQVHASGIAE